MGLISKTVSAAAKGAGKAAKKASGVATESGRSSREVDERQLNEIREAGRKAHRDSAQVRAQLEAEVAERLAKLPSRSKQANEAAGLYHPIGGGIKLSRPVYGMHATTVPDPMFNPPEIGLITPEQLVKEEAALFPLVGDRAAAGRYLTHIGENELARPVRLTGGARYMDANYDPMNPEESAAWESGAGRVTALARQAARAGEGGRPVYGVYTAGSATNTDFNVMGANALIQQLPYSKISKKAESEFDRAMREGSKDFPPIPDWPGIKSPEAESLLLDKSKGVVRTKLFGLMGKEKFQSMGFPDVAATRKAIVEPELLNVDTNQAGFRLARMDPSGRVIEQPKIPSDYPVAMAGQVAGRLDVPADYKDIWQSHFEGRRLFSQPESGDYYSFSRAHPIQYADEEWLNKLMEKRYAAERKIKEGEYKDGGAVKMAEGGEIDAMMEAVGPDRESSNSPLLEALGVVGKTLPKAMVSPLVGVVGSLRSGKYGTQEGVRAGEKAMEEFMDPGEVNISPKAVDYLQKMAKFAEELETKYKLPPLLPEALPLAGIRGAGVQAKKIAKDVAKSADAALKEVPIPAGLSIQAVGEVPTGAPGKVKVPANELGFYSPVEKAAVNLQRKQGTGQSFISDIMKQAGVRQEEMDAIGLTDWLKSQKSVTKQDVVDYIQGNKLDIKEVKYGTVLTPYERNLRNQVREKLRAGDRISPEDEAAYEQIMAKAAEFKAPLYESDDLIIPGGKNYREIVLTLPQGDLNKGYESTHWKGVDTPIAHIRMQDMDIDGKKTLVIEEIQSDLHQEGRDKGYRPKGTTRSEFMTKYANVDRSQAEKALEQADNEYLSAARKGEVNKELVEKVRAAQKALDDIKAEEQRYAKLADSPPDVPFKDTWYQLAMRRAMKYAADNDYQQIAIVGASEQAKRYNLSKKIDAIGVSQADEGKKISVQVKGGGTVDFVVDGEGQVISSSSPEFDRAIGKSITNVVGKPMGRKLMDMETGVVSGEDLDIGGKGMITYYDEIYPKFLEKQGKKYGAKVNKKVTSADRYGPDDVEVETDFMNDDFYVIRHPESGEVVGSGYSVEEALQDVAKQNPSIPLWTMDLPKQMKQDVKIGVPLAKGGSINNKYMNEILEEELRRYA